MFCQNCGEKISDNAKFCPECGSRIEYPAVAEDVEYVIKTRVSTAPGSGTEVPSLQSVDSVSPDQSSQPSQTKKILCVLTSLLIGISAFLPYIKVTFLGSTLTKSLFEGGDGVILLVIAVIALIGSLLRKYVLTTIAGAAALGLFFFENSSMTNALADAGDLARQMLQNGAGYYALLVGGITLIVFSIIRFN